MMIEQYMIFVAELLVSIFLTICLIVVIHWLYRTVREIIEGDPNE